MKTSINGLLGLIGAITVFTTVSVCFSNCSSEDDFGEMEEMIATMAEKKMTRSGYEGGLGGEETTNLLPSKSEIRSNAIVSAKMQQVWRQTIESAKNGERCEFGFAIYYKNNAYTFSDVIQGPPADTDASASISLPLPSDSYMCAVFHTHTALTNCTPGSNRKTGPSSSDLSSSHASIMPCFVYDYEMNQINDNCSIEAPGKLYDYGVERRTL